MKFCGGSQTVSMKMAEHLGGEFEVNELRMKPSKYLFPTKDEVKMARTEKFSSSLVFFTP